MLENISFLNFTSNMKKFKGIPSQYEEELSQKLLNINLNREAVLAIILLAIDIFLLLIDFISTKAWTINEHVFGYFSFMHVMLMIIPLIFLALICNRRVHSCSKTNLCRILHLAINTLVLIFCALISIDNGKVERLPYPYIIAMFCIASTVILKRKERFIMYTLSYVLYVLGCFVVTVDIYHLFRDTFFITLLFILALIVSHMHYSSFLNSFLNDKIILDKNKELDSLYRDAEETLKLRTKELNETVEYEKLRSAFFANISHELRTPLTVIFSAEQMLNLIMKRENYQNGNKEIKKYMEIIRQNCYRLIRLVANLIDITKIDAGYFHVSLKNCDIIKVVEDITLSVAKFIEDRDIDIVFDTEIEEMITACDPDKIERIILNLLSNAVKFTPKGGSIFVNIFEKDDKIRIHIKDTGIGVPINMQESIFERFIQVDKTISRNHEGSGIGLSLVKSLVDLHEGNIKLISDEGKGSEFIIEIPVRLIDFEESDNEQMFLEENQNVEKINIEFSDIYR